ncbi:hypothetical protein HDV06_003977 [Boothiomyces sp. JEL0866]|nr:hypothetical protein HDV06_003977 [Boothiomyces sp. JEL0866]
MNLRNYLNGKSPATIILIATSLIFSFADYLTDYSVFSIIPMQTVFKPWTLLTAALVQKPLFLINLPILYFMGSYFEGYWGKVEFLRHFVIIVVGTNVITSMIMIFRNIFFADEDDLFQLINGLGSFLCALLVAFKRAVPEHNLEYNGLSIRVKVRQSNVVSSIH